MPKNKVYHKIITKSLLDSLGLVASLSSRQLSEAIGKSQATIYRYRDEMLDVEVEGFEWYFYSKIDALACEYIYQYSQLVDILGRRRASERIHDHMKELLNGKKDREIR